VGAQPHAQRGHRDAPFGRAASSARSASKTAGITRESRYWRVSRTVPAMATYQCRRHLPAGARFKRPSPPPSISSRTLTVGTRPGHVTALSGRCQQLLDIVAKLDRSDCINAPSSKMGPILVSRAHGRYSAFRLRARHVRSADTSRRETEHRRLRFEQRPRRSQAMRE
jgi:hypothetical protein